MMKKENPLLNMKADASSGLPVSASPTDDILTEADKRKMKRNALIKMAAMLLFIVIVLVFGSIAWFTMIKDNRTSGMGIRVGTDTYQIVSVEGNASIFEPYRLDSIKSSDALVWNMTASSNMNNYNSATDNGISPGACGTLSFLVKPAETSIHLDLTFQITGYRYTAASENNETHEVTPESMSVVDDFNYLFGHILLFEERTTEYYKNPDGTDSDRVKTYHYSKPILSDNTGKKILQNREFLKSDENTPVEIYWVWPKTLSTLVYASENDNVNIEPFCNWQSKTTDEDYDSSYHDIIDNIITYPSYYLAGYTAGDTPLTASIIAAQYDTYGPEYDRADNEIGANINYVVLKMATNETSNTP